MAKKRTPDSSRSSKEAIQRREALKRLGALAITAPTLASIACDEEPDMGMMQNNVEAGAPGGSPGGTLDAGGGTMGGGTQGGGTQGGGTQGGGTQGGGTQGGGTQGGGTQGGGTQGGGTQGGGTMGGGTTGGATMGGATMGGGTMGGNNFVKCDSNGTTANTMPCGSFVSTEGVELKFGPYGGQMDPNVGVGFEVLPIDTGNEDLPLIGSVCAGFAGLFGEDPTATMRLLNITNLKLDLHTVYRPAVWPQGKVPIVTWGNGTCAQPEGYGSLLRYVASHGVFVVAANNRFVGSGEAQKKALDFAFAANMDPNSPYYQKLDTDKVLAMGHSQGGMGTAAAASDPRIKAVILFNGGTSASKPFLAISGDMDIQGGTAQDYAAQVMGSSQSKAAWLWYHKIVGMGGLAGHLTLMTQPERVAPATLAWIKYTLLDDAESKSYFVGPNCKLCNMTMDFEYGQKGIQ